MKEIPPDLLQALQGKKGEADLGCLGDLPKPDAQAEACAHGGEEKDNQEGEEEEEEGDDEGTLSAPATPGSEAAASSKKRGVPKGAAKRPSAAKRKR